MNIWSQSKRMEGSKEDKDGRMEGWKIASPHPSILPIFHLLIHFTFYVFWLSGFTNAWSHLAFSGFLENRIELVSHNEASPLNPGNRFLNLGDISDQLRLRLSVDTAEYSAAGAHARISYFDNLTDARFRHTTVVDEASLNLDLPGRINGILGKKRLAWGPSFLWNPTDVLSPPKNPQDPEPDENREGALLMRLERSLGNVTVTGVVAPEAIEENAGQFREVSAHLKRTQLIGKVDWLVYDADLTALVQYGQFAEERKWRFGLSFSRVFFGATELHGEWIGQRGFIRPSLVPDNLQLISDRRGDDLPVIGFVLGLHHSFPSNIRLIIEYYHNDEGYSSAEVDELVDVLQTIGMRLGQTQPPVPNDFYQHYLVGVNQEVSALTGNLSKNYAYIRLMQPRLDERFTIEGNVLWNLDDSSMLLFAEGAYETTTNIFVFMRADAPVNFNGEDTSEFGGLGVRSLSLRLGGKVYF